MTFRKNLDHALAFLPAAILIVVALNHLWHTRTEPLSSWRGGGFGMYADIIDQRGRYIRIYVLQDRWNPAQINERLTARVTRVRTNPSAANIQALANDFACNPLFLDRNKGIRQLRFEYWAMQFDASAYILEMQKQLVVTREPC